MRDCQPAALTEGGMVPVPCQHRDTPLPIPSQTIWWVGFLKLSIGGDGAKGPGHRRLGFGTTGIGGNKAEDDGQGVGVGGAGQ